MACVVQLCLGEITLAVDNLSLLQRQPEPAAEIDAGIRDESTSLAVVSMV